jgi:hypothetical protein
VATSTKPAKLGFGATMAEVAALAGVTKMTVSRVVRQPEKVNPETRQRVTEAMTRLGYVPNRLAGSLTAGSTGLVAAIVPTLRHSLFADTLEGLSEAGLGLFVSSSTYRTDVEESQIRSILERRPDAIVLTGLTHTSAARNLLRGFGIPVVETWETSDEPVDMVVGYSNREAAHAMTAELIRSGYRRIAFVNGPAENNERARHRAEGYMAAMQEAGLSRPRRGGDPAGKRRQGDPHPPPAGRHRRRVLYERRLRRRRHPRLPRTRHRRAGPDGHRRLPRPRGRPGGDPDADHGAGPGDGDGAEGRAHDPRPSRGQEDAPPAPGPRLQHHLARKHAPDAETGLTGYRLPVT